MPKKIPECPKKPNSAPGATHSFEIELITPMVGGGASPGAVDLDFPIRPTAIRGHLRHWWRLMRGHSLGDGMWRREEEIFGSTEFPSPLTVRVEPLTKAEQFDPTDNNIVDRFCPVSYALFASIENEQKVTKEGLKFTVYVQHASNGELTRRRAAQNEHRRKAGRDRLPASIEPIAGEIEQAVNAWLTFGGIGGRTRRGCGAIRAATVLGSLPKIPARIFLGSVQKTPLEAWSESLFIYREFRQTPRGKRHRKTLRSGKVVQVPGRSHWPEADAIRKITGCSLKPLGGTPSGNVPADEDTHDHSKPVVPSQLLPAFPKAVLGLPINFHFADGPNKGNAAANLDPKDVQLYPLLRAANGQVEKADRMASPIITRPVLRDEKWYPAIIIMDQVLPDGLQVRLEGKNAALKGNLSDDFAVSRVIDKSLGVLTPMRGKASAIEALIEFVLNEKKWGEQ